MLGTEVVDVEAGIEMSLEGREVVDEFPAPEPVLYDNFLVSSGGGLRPVDLGAGVLIALVALAIRRRDLRRSLGTTIELETPSWVYPRRCGVNLGQTGRRRTGLYGDDEGVEELICLKVVSGLVDPLTEKAGKSDNMV